MQKKNKNSAREGRGLPHNHLLSEMFIINEYKNHVIDKIKFKIT